MVKYKDQSATFN